MAVSNLPEPSLFPNGNHDRTWPGLEGNALPALRVPGAAWRDTLTHEGGDVKHYSIAGRSVCGRLMGRGLRLPPWLGASSNSSVWMIDSASLAIGILRS